MNIANSWLSGFFLAGLCCVSSLPAQEEQPPVAGRYPANALYEGIESCERCHTKPNRYAQDFILLNESSIWSEHDKHAQAFRLLVGLTDDGETSKIDTQALGLNMMRRLTGSALQADFEQLEAAAEDAKKQLATANSATDRREATRGYLNAAVNLFLNPASNVGRGCLACHANLQSKATYHSPEVEKSFREASIPDGVSCEACHGPSGLWKGPHEAKVVSRAHLLAAELPVDKAHGFEMSWRELTPAQKLKFGMEEVRNPAVRAKLCLSCHIGEIPGATGERKLIPHAWYVAGHPPLPSMELATFAREMPRHWRTLAEKKNFDKRTEFIAAQGWNQGDYQVEQDLPETKALLLGSVVALRKSVELLQAVRKETPGFIPDFAAYDCLACHQELRNAPVVTREQFENSVPGRPGLPRWATSFVEQTLVVAGDPTAQERFQTAFQDLRGTLSKQPFGQTKQIDAAATSLLATLDSVEQQLLHKTVTQADAASFSQALVAVRSQPVDFHTARQIAWALERLREESPDAITLEPTLVDQLSLRLPAGKQKSLSENLPLWLRRASDYEPALF